LSFDLDSFGAVSGDETNEQEAHAGRLSDYLSLGVVARIYRRDLVDQVLVDTQQRGSS
jgi:hypothetical protein